MRDNSIPFLTHNYSTSLCIDIASLESILLLCSERSSTEPQNSYSKSISQLVQPGPKIPGDLFQYRRRISVLEFLFGLWTLEPRAVASIYHKTQQVVGECPQRWKRQHDRSLLFVHESQQASECNLFGMRLAGIGIEPNPGRGLSWIYCQWIQTDNNLQYKQRQKSSGHDRFESSPPTAQQYWATDHFQPPTLSRCQSVSVFL